MLSIDMVVGAAQVMMSNKIPEITVSAFVFNSCVALVATSARANMTTCFCWVKSSMTELKLHSERDEEHAYFNTSVFCWDSK